MMGMGPGEDIMKDGMQFALLATLVVALFSCKATNREASSLRIQGGVEVDSSFEVPILAKSTVAITDDGKYHHCSGTIISEKAVLTAAHLPPEK